MKINKSKIIISLIIIFFATSLCGCWDYVEIDDFKNAAGIAIDKDKIEDEYIVTVEIVEAYTGAKELESHIVQSRGETIHIAFRNAIKKIGNKIQLSHARIVIISKDIAKEGIVPAIDLINRDAELRNDMWIMISQEQLASKILTKPKSQEEIISYDIETAIKNNNQVGKYLGVETYKLTDTLSSEGIDSALPMIKLAPKNRELEFEVSGTAVFKGEKMVGELTEKETLMLQLFNGRELELILPIKIEGNGFVSLETLKYKKKIKVKLEEDKIVMNSYIDLDTTISELANYGVNYIDANERDKLKHIAEEQIENDIYMLLEKLQKQYKSDAIGFGKVLKQKKPKAWKKVKDNWNEVFEFLSINVSVNVNIRYSGLINKNIEVKN